MRVAQKLNTVEVAQM